MIGSFVLKRKKKKRKKRFFAYYLSIPFFAWGELFRNSNTKEYFAWIEFIYRIFVFLFDFFKQSFPANFFSKIKRQCGGLPTGFSTSICNPFFARRNYHFSPPLWDKTIFAKLGCSPDFQLVFATLFCGGGGIFPGWKCQTGKPVGPKNL